MTKTPLELAQTAFSKWLEGQDGLLHEAELAFEEFSGLGQLGDMQGAGAALARAESLVKQVRAEIKAGLEAGV